MVISEVRKADPISKFEPKMSDNLEPHSRLHVRNEKIRQKYKVTDDFSKNNNQ